MILPLSSGIGGLAFLPMLNSDEIGADYGTAEHE